MEPEVAVVLRVQRGGGDSRVLPHLDVSSRTRPQIQLRSVNTWISAIWTTHSGTSKEGLLTPTAQEWWETKIED